MTFKKTGKQVKVTKICEVCGKEFEAWKYKADTVKYCSNKCRYKRNNPKLNQIRKIIIEESFVIKTCQNPLCKKKFKVPKNLENQKYCSKDCFREAVARDREDKLKEIKRKKEEENKRNIWRLNG